MPSTKPAGWSDADFANLRYMMLQPCPVGFGVQSQNSRFEIVDQQEISDDDKIYDIKDDGIYAFIKGSWVKIGKTSDVLPHKVWLYNDVTNSLYWYQEPGKYILIECNMISNIKSSLEGQLPKVIGGGIKMHDNFMKLNVVDNDDDFNHQKILSTNTIYRIDTDEVYKYISETWKLTDEKASNVIPYEMFVYNESLHRFFLYKSKKNYNRIKLLNI